MLEQPCPSERSQRGLDWLNFFVADVETAFGPFLATYLALNGWSKPMVGTVLAVNSAVALGIRMPTGWLVDRIAAKWVVVAGCLGCILIGCLLIALFPTVVPVLVAEVLHGITGGSVRVAISAMAIGLVGHRALHTRIGRNHRYNSVGNALTAAGMGMLGHFASPRSPFFATAGLCIPAAIALLLIRHREIDPARSRQAASDEHDKACRWRDMAGNRSLVIFADIMFLFQFANASILPLATERLTAEHGHVSELVTSAFVAVPQFITAVIALRIARHADETGRKPLLMLGLAALLARAGLFALDPGPWLLVAVRVLGGLTAAVIGILLPLVVADVTRGSGRYNLALGAVGMTASIGATLSTPATGFIAQTFGFMVSFLLLAAVAAAACALIWFFLPETTPFAREAD